MAPRSVQSIRSILGGHDSSSSTSLNSFRPSVPRLTDDAARSSLAFWQPVESLEDLPEELIVAILSHMDDKELLSCSCTSRSMNRLAVQLLLTRNNIPDPVGGNGKVKLTFKTPKDSADALTALLHSVHIKAIKRLDIRFVRYPSACSLVAPLCRTLRVLRNLNCIDEMALDLPSHLARDGASTPDKAIREIILAFEDVLNEAILKSCKRLYLQGSCNLMEQVYQFRRDDSTHSSPAHGGGRKFLQHLIGARDYLDRRKEKDIDDAVVQDDFRYSRTTLAGSRIFAHCSSPALSQTQLTHINMSTVDFLRPPLSQWLLSMLRASPMNSMSFHFNNLPKPTPDSQEHDFMLARLAAVLPTLQSLHIAGLKEPVLPTFVEFINRFPQLTRIIIEPPKEAQTLASFASMRAPFNNVNSDFNPTPHTFAYTLRTIDGPLHYLVWLFQTACPRVSDTLCPELPVRLAADLVPRFPSLRKVHIDCYCVRGVLFEISTLAEVIRSIQEAISSPSGLIPSRKRKVIIEVHLKFDKDFRGLLPLWSKGDISVSQASLAKAVAKNVLIDIEGSGILTRWIGGLQAAPDTTAQPSTRAPSSLDNEDGVAPDSDHSEALTEKDEEDDGGDEELNPDAMNLAVLATVQMVSITLPGPRRDILDGKFKEQILGVVTIFWGLKYLKLLSTGAGTRKGYVTPVSLPGIVFEVFKARNPRLRRIHVY